MSSVSFEADLNELVPCAMCPHSETSTVAVVGKTKGKVAAPLVRSHVYFMETE